MFSTAVRYGKIGLMTIGAITLFRACACDASPLEKTVNMYEAPKYEIAKYK